MFSIFDNSTGKRVSEESYATAEEANHDYYMNHGSTHVGIISGETREAVFMAKAFPVQHLAKLLRTNERNAPRCTTLSGLAYVESQIVILRRAIMIAKAA